VPFGNRDELLLVLVYVHRPFRHLLEQLSVLRRFVAEADQRPPHLALDNVLTIAEWMEIEPGGRLTEFQARTFAAFLLGAAQLPADTVDPEIVPRWFSPADEACYAGGKARSV
jgi:hypothetical protein